MTCQQVYELTQKPIESSTRAERSAMCQHLDNCQTCREWMQKAPKPTLEQVAEVDAIREADQSSGDEEYIP